MAQSTLKNAIDQGANSNSSNQFVKPDGEKMQSNPMEVPSTTLPRGGGSIKGIDEKFSVNAVSGTGSFVITLSFSQTRANTPTLDLTYNSGSGNGIFGLGWAISLSSIKRKTDKECPTYIDSVVETENRFYVPTSFKDPLGSKINVHYYSNYFLLIDTTIDALQNQTSILSFNMRTLSAERIQDPNMNISQAISDELGFIKVMAVFGKGAQADDLVGLTDFSSAVTSTDLTATGKSLLYHATAITETLQGHGEIILHPLANLMFEDCHN